MKQSKWRNISLVLILAAVFISLLPYLISTTIGTKSCVWIYNQISGNRLSVEKLDVSWLGPQTFEEIQWSDAKNSLNFQGKQIELNCSFIELFKRQSHFKKARFLSPVIIARPDLHRSHPLALQQMSLLPKMQWQWHPKFSGNFEIIDGQAAIYSGQNQIALFKDMTALLMLEKNFLPLKIEMKAETYQEKIQGNCMIQATVTALDRSHPQFEINAKMDHFPIQGLDMLASAFYPQLKNIFLETIGPTIDLELHTSSEMDSGELSLQAKSQFFQASLLTSVKGQTLALKNPALFSLTIDPISAHQLLPKWLTDIALENPLQLRLSLNQFTIPITKNGLDITHLSCLASLKIDPLMATVQQEPLELGASVFTIETKNLNDLFTFNAKQVFMFRKQPFNFEIQGSCQGFFEPSFQANVTTSLHAFPLELLATITSNPLFSHLGNTLESQFVWHTSQAQQTLQGQLHTQVLEIPLISLQSDNQWHLLKPCQGKFHWASDAFLFNIDQLNFPRLADLQLINLDANIESPQKINSSSFLLKLCEKMQCKLHSETLNKIHLSLQGPYLNTDLFAAFDLTTKKIENTQPFSIHYQAMKDDPFLQKNLFFPRRLDMQVQEISTVLTEEDFYKSLHIKSDGTLQSPIEETPLAKDFSYSLLIDGSKQHLHADFTGPMLSGEINSNEWYMQDPLASLLQFNLSAKQLPLALIADISHCPSLPFLFGTTLNAELSGFFSEKTWNCTIQGKTPSIDCSCSLQAKDGKLYTKDKAYFKWKIPSDDLTSYFKKIAQMPYQGSPFLFQLQINELESPITFENPLKIYDWKWNLNELKFKGKITLDPMTITQLSTNKSFSSSLWTTDLSKKSDEPQLTLQSTAQFTSKENSSSKEGSIQFTSIIDCQDFKWTAPNFDLEAKAQKMPVLCCDFFYSLITHQPFIFSSLIGNFFNLNLSLQIKEGNGPMDFSFLSDHARCSLTAAWQKSTLGLVKPLYAQMDLTKESSTQLLKEINPLSISSLQSDHPLTIEIAPVGFSASFFPFNINTLSIEKCRIELGQIHCQNEGNLNVALGLLKQNIMPSSTLDLWFTPIDLYLKGGSLQIERTEILVQNTLEICSWGNIDFIHDHISMILGLTPQCLKKAFGIKNLPPNYVLQIPMEGPIDDVKIDTARATNKVTALLLWQKAASAASEKGGAVGGFFGDLLGKAALLPDNDAKSPPPKQPFPWDKQKKNQNTSLYESEEKRSKKKCRIKKTEKPLKQLFKILK